MASSKEGFSALELLVVLSVVGILTILGAPDFLSQIPRNNLNGASRQIISDLRLIRQQAIAAGVPKSIRFDPNSQSYRISPTQTRGFPSSVRFGARQGVSHLPNANSMPPDGVSFKDHTATFKPDGTVNLAGAIYLTDDPVRNETVAVSVNITGRVKIYRWNGHAWD